MYEVTENLSDRAYRFIKQEMQQGALVPGVQLVNRKLASEIGVSVIPVREAIHRLVTEGLVEHVPGAGAFVRKPNREDLEELYVLRDALESCGAAEAARYITPHQLDDLESIMSEFHQIAESIQKRSDGHATPSQFHRWLDCEEAFHEIVIDASRNRLISKVIREHRAIATVFESQRNSSKLLTQELAEKTCERKEQLLAALRDGNASLARELMSAHIQQGCKDVLAFLRQQERRA
ncbi:GntR family transcriptional regulator [Gimesia aquarii]|uniref:HTH-type transcriptional regulator McbR n=1 Tax=Gimesia aquarii TaxID=2527964 RepID=A0A517VYV5_9PLAN|nr:GntR family transcriptional regulator [Gimesia aquarii]QDT98194.1 HTH-type transcriptional regulator McbR [Gimesia aquarii]QDU09390.1 HTH-type transcriptional regulator McbR [Gimesia aquarii]